MNRRRLFGLLAAAPVAAALPAMARPDAILPLPGGRRIGVTTIPFDPEFAHASEGVQVISMTIRPVTLTSGPLIDYGPEMNAAIVKALNLP